MLKKIRTRIEELRSRKENADILATSKIGPIEVGAMASEIYQNELAFLQSLSLEIETRLDLAARHRASVAHSTDYLKADYKWTDWLWGCEI